MAARWHPAEEEWHVLSEFKALMLGWIDEWEFDGYDTQDPDVWIGDVRDGIDAADAEYWVRSHWVREPPPAYPPPPSRVVRRTGKPVHEWLGEGRAVRETDAMWRERMRQEEARHGERATGMAARWRKRLKRAEALHGARPVRPGPTPGNTKEQARVYMVVMVAFLVYAGLSATRNRRRKDRRAQDTACDVVAKGAGVAYRTVEKAWERYKRFFPFKGRSPVLPTPHEVLELDKKRKVWEVRQKRGYHYPEPDVVSEVERRRMAYEWIMIGLRTRALRVELSDYGF